MTHFRLASKINAFFTAYLQIFIYSFKQPNGSIYTPHYYMLVQLNWYEMSPHFLPEECETIMEVRNQGLTTEPRFLPSVNYFIASLYLLSNIRFYSKCTNWEKSVAIV